MEVICCHILHWKYTFVFSVSHIFCYRMYNTGGSSGLAFLQYVATMFTLRATIDLNEISSRRKLCSIFYKIWPLCCSVLYEMYQEFNQLWGKESLANKGLPLPLAVKGGLPNATPHYFPEYPWVIILHSADWLSTHAIFGQIWTSPHITINFEAGVKKGNIFTTKAQYRDVVCLLLTWKGQKWSNDP